MEDGGENFTGNMHGLLWLCDNVVTDETVQKGDLRRRKKTEEKGEFCKNEEYAN